MSELNTAATNIYNRLLSAPTFHPASADLFTDWNMQAGDVVTVMSDSDSYQVPIYNMKLKWTGAPKVEVESTGNPEREPLPAIKRREYSANSSNYKEQKSLRGGVGQAQSGVREINGVLYAAGLQIDPVTGVWLYASEHGADYALGATFKVQSDAITSEVSRATTAEGTLSSQITQTADAIRLKVSKGDVATQLSVECGNVTISGGNLVVSGYITSQGLVTAMASFSGQISAPSVVADAFYLGRSESSRLVQKEVKMGTLAFTNSFTLGTGTAGTMDLGHYHDISASESNGVITITQGAAQSTAGTATFNIADTQFYKDAVRSARSEGVQSVRILADDITLNGNPTYYSSSKQYSVPVYAEATNGKSNTNGIMIDASEAWSAGWDDANAQYSAASYARKNLNRYGRADMYVKERETYYPAGNHYWYWSGSDGWDTLYTKSSS